MKIFTTFLLVLTTYSCFGQFSVSAGASRLRENLFRNEKLPSLRKNELYLYNCFLVQVDYTKSFFRTYLELGFLPASFRHVEKTYIYGGTYDSDSQYTDSREYYSTVRFGYLSIKGGIGKEFKKINERNRWSSFSFNIFGQYERLLYESASDNVMFKTLTSGSSSIVYPPNYYSPDLLGLSSNMALFGIELKERLGIQHYFVEFSLGLSSSINYRAYKVNLHSETYNNQKSSWSLSPSVKLGYSFQGKSKADQKEPKEL